MHALPHERTARPHRVRLRIQPAGRIPMLRLISTNPDEYTVSWGTSELISRYLFVLVFAAVFIVAFGVACLLFHSLDGAARAIQWALRRRTSMPPVESAPVRCC